MASAARNKTKRIQAVNFKERRFEIAVFCSSDPVGRSEIIEPARAAHRAAATEELKRSALWKGMRSLKGVAGVPDHGRKQENRADHRHYRAGWLVSGGAASGKGLCRAW